jgi:hypothetical protein
MPKDRCPKCRSENDHCEGCEYITGEVEKFHHFDLSAVG